MSSEITGDRLTSLFRPSSVALVGASDKSTFSRIACQNLVRFGFGERTYLVNRRGAETHGQPTVTSCTQIGEPVDVAYLMVPQAGTLAAMDDAAAAGIRNAVVLSSGYGEAGEAGRAAEAELAAHARSLGMVLLGPNHLGFANFVDRVPVCSIPGLPEEGGPVALLSQSGASSSAMLDFAAMVNVGLSYIVTLGNEAMITAGHVLDFLVDDPATRAVAIFMEMVRDPDAFRRAARRAAEAGKAIVVLKAGSSALSARTAAAHTGALVGDDRVIDAVFADLGVIRVDSIEDMLITAGAAAALGRLERPGIGIVSISGGACDIVADRAEDLGADLPELAEPTRQAVVSPQILHKSDIGGVRLNVPADEQAIRDAYAAVTAAAGTVDGACVEGVLVSPMRSGGTELLAGVVRDPQWGPVLAVALGGIFVEVLEDSALAPLPVTPGRARALLEKLRGRAVLHGSRGTTPADLDALAAVIARIGDLALALGGELESVEVNPLRVDGATVEALDAVVTWTSEKDI